MSCARPPRRPGAYSCRPSGADRRSAETWSYPFGRDPRIVDTGSEQVASRDASLYFCLVHKRSRIPVSYPAGWHRWLAHQCGRGLGQHWWASHRCHPAAALGRLKIYAARTPYRHAPAVKRERLVPDEPDSPRSPWRRVDAQRIRRSPRLYHRRTLVWREPRPPGRSDGIGRAAPEKVWHGPETRSPLDGPPDGRRRPRAPARNRRTRGPKITMILGAALKIAGGRRDECEHPSLSMADSVCLWHRRLF